MLDSIFPGISTFDNSNLNSQVKKELREAEESVAP